MHSDARLRKSVTKLCEKVETSIHVSKANEENQKIKQLEDAVGLLISKLNNIFPVHPIRELEEDADNQQHSTELLDSRLFDSLFTALEQNDTEAMSIIESLKSPQSIGLSKVQLNQLESAINNFDFDSAINILASVKDLKS